MSRFLSIVVLLLVVVACVGFFRGWFIMSSNMNSRDDKMDVHFQVDKDMMKQDANTVREKTKSMLGTEENRDGQQR